jgi:hypothetical protein
MKGQNSIEFSVRRAAMLLVLIVTGAGLLGGCVSRDDVHIQVNYVDHTDATPIDNLTVFAGGNKTWWPTLTPGKSVSVVLPPNGDADITMTYTLAGTKRYWRGPVLAQGASYAISITIAGEGNITERHCTMPCSLP